MFILCQAQFQGSTSIKSLNPPNKALKQALPILHWKEMEKQKGEQFAQGHPANN